MVNRCVLFLMLLALSACSAACSKLDPFDPMSAERLCKESRDLTRQHFDEMEYEEKTSNRLWFWVEASYPGQAAQKGAIYVDRSTGFMLLAHEAGKIGAWISVDVWQTVYEGYDRWQCDIDIILPGEKPGIWREELPVKTGIPWLEAKAAAEEMAWREFARVFGEDPEIMGGAHQVKCDMLETFWDAPWPTSAGEEPPFADAEEAAGMAFRELTVAGNRTPVPLNKTTALSVSAARELWNVDQPCRVNDDRPGRAPDPDPIPDAPPGATPPDRGGIDVPPGTTPGGNDDGGDR